MPPKLILLPGLHGTADLFSPFLKTIPARFHCRAISYPTDQYLTYDQLLCNLEEQLSEEQSMVLIAESFSGPIAIRFAASHPQRVKALVLCSSFIRLPRPSWFRQAIAPLLFHLPIFLPALRRYLAGPDVPRELLFEMRDALKKTSPRVLLSRLRESFRIDCSDALAKCEMPLLYLRGTEDRMMPRDALTSILAVHPGTQVREIRGPHMLLQVCPADSWREIQQFLSGIMSP